MDTMQEEAIKRMREMEKRSKSAIGYNEYMSNSKVESNKNNISQPPPNYNKNNSYNYNYNKNNFNYNKKDNIINNKEKEVNQYNKDENILKENKKELIQESNNNFKSNNLLEELFKDKEKTLILALIALLCTEKTDYVLVLALIYLII